MRRRAGLAARAVVAAVAVAVAAGCGGDDGEGREGGGGEAAAAAKPALVKAGPAVFDGQPEGEAITDSVALLAETTTAGDTMRLCAELVAAELNELFAEVGSSCAEFVGPGLKEEAGATPWEITRADVKGDRATVTYRSGGAAPEEEQLDLVKDRGRWRMTLPRAHR